MMERSINKRIQRPKARDKTKIRIELLKKFKVKKVQVNSPDKLLAIFISFSHYFTFCESSNYLKQNSII